MSANAGRFAEIEATLRVLAVTNSQIDMTPRAPLKRRDLLKAMSVSRHEAGHALAAQSRGIEVGRITLDSDSEGTTFHARPIDARDVEAIAFLCWSGVCAQHYGCASFAEAKAGLSRSDRDGIEDFVRFRDRDYCGLGADLLNSPSSLSLFEQANEFARRNEKEISALAAQLFHRKEVRL